MKARWILKEGDRSLSDYSQEELDEIGKSSIEHLQGLDEIRDNKITEQLLRMAMPMTTMTITFPVPQDKMKSETQNLLALIREKAAEIKFCQTMLAVLRATCHHEYKSKQCIYCSHDYD